MNKLEDKVVSLPDGKKLSIQVRLAEGDPTTLRIIGIHREDIDDAVAVPELLNQVGTGVILRALRGVLAEFPYVRKVEFYRSTTEGKRRFVRMDVPQRKIASMVPKFQTGEEVMIIGGSFYLGNIGIVENAIERTSGMEYGIRMGGQIAFKHENHLKSTGKITRIARSLVASIGDNKMTAADPNTDPQYCGDPDTHGINSPRGGGFSIMKDLAKDLHNESYEFSDINPRIAKIAKKIAKEDTAEEIATDVVKRAEKDETIPQTDLERFTTSKITEAFKEIGYSKLYWNTRACDIPDNYQSLSTDQKIKAMTVCIEKAMKRMDKAGKSYK